jgi:site-specific DNA-methyltransferase (adenine-specific)
MAIHTGGRYEAWETPPEIFGPLNAEFRFTLDVCADANNAKAPAYFTREQDGLSQSWAALGSVWCNPPYGRAIAAWVRKAWVESCKGVTVVCLVPARTDAAWWHDYALRGEVRFVRGRIRFVGAPFNAPFPSAVIVFRAADREG